MPHYDIKLYNPLIVNSTQGIFDTIELILLRRACSRSSRPEVFDKKDVLLIIWHEKSCLGAFFFDKVAGWKAKTLLKRDFSKGLFLCIFWNTFWCELLLDDFFFDAVVVGSAGMLNPR